MQFDECPHCRKRLEIVGLKFGFNGVATVSACPSCGIASSDDGKRLGASARLMSAMVAAFDMMDELNARLRYLVAFVIAAVITAAVLRHSLHIYGGLPREEIRVNAMTALIPAVSFLLILLARKRRR
jgi:hypothetical protein